ncbi:MAG: hypothetical protein RL238_2158 [Actinomycetota bacterium]|jgi:hypothetical protein
MTARRWSALFAFMFVVATSSCEREESVERTLPSLEVTAELRSTSDDCVELVVDAVSAFEGCATDFQAGPSVVYLGLTNGLYVVFVAEGQVVDGDDYVVLQSQEPFSLVTLIDKSRNLYQHDFAVERDGRTVTCRPVGVIGFLECG